MRRHKIPGLNARERAHWHGWVFRPINPMPELILRARYAHLRARIEKTNELRAERTVKSGLHRKAPDQPLTDAVRTWNYVRQIGVRRNLTPAQQRRRAHKAHVSRAALAGLAGTR